MSRRMSDTQMIDHEDCWIEGEVIAWQLHSDGATYWILAISPTEALDLWLENEAVRDALDYQDGASLDLQPITQGALADLSFVGENGETTMLDEMRRDPSARVVACTEWTY